MVGEIRTLIFPIVQQRINDTLLNPLDADAFLVATRRWTRMQNLKSRGDHDLAVPHYDDDAPASVSVANVTRIRAALPRIQSAMIADDEEMLDVAAKWVADGGDLASHRSSSMNASRRSAPLLMDPRERCRTLTANHSYAWQRRLCRTRVLVAARLRACLLLIEDAEATRARASHAPSKPYAAVVRTRPDIWLACVLRPSALHFPSNFVAFAWDYLTLLSRVAASISLRELELAPSIPACSQPHKAEPCNPCLLRKYGFANVWANFHVDIARQCQLLAHEKGHQTCHGFDGPTNEPPLAVNGTSLSCGRFDQRLFIGPWGCDDDQGGGGGGGIPRHDEEGEGREGTSSERELAALRAVNAALSRAAGR